jgi:hypothetical protein
MKNHRTQALSVCLIVAAGSISLWAQDKPATGRGDLTQDQLQLKLAPGASVWNQPTNQTSPLAQAATTGMVYHGGPVILGTTNVYYIWYGNNWSTNTAVGILTDFASTIGGTPWYNINTTYYNGSNTHVSNLVHYTTQYTVSGTPYGTSLPDSQIQKIVSDAITGGHLPSDANAVYFVLTSKEIKETSGFCSQYCGWHTRATIGGKDIKYAFVGNPDQCPSSCSAQSTSPNGNPGADAMASIIAHELVEAVSDPDLNAWYDRSGNENGDKCAWNFGTTTSVNGYRYNVTFGARNFLIQQNWKNAAPVGCALK